MVLELLNLNFSTNVALAYNVKVLGEGQGLELQNFKTSTNEQ
jgi:hypothetical protein